MDWSVNKRTVVTKYNVKTTAGQWQRFIWVTLAKFLVRK